MTLHWQGSLSTALSSYLDYRNIYNMPNRDEYTVLNSRMQNIYGYGLNIIEFCYGRL